MACMNVSSVSTVALLVLLAFPVTASAEGKPVRVHVLARTPVVLDAAEKKAREKETDVERKRTEQARKDVEKALVSRHGKGRQDWPAEASGQLEEAWRAEARALLAHHEVKIDPKDLADSADDVADALKDEIKKQPQVAMAASAEQADLVVEVLTRRGKTSFPAAAFILYLKVTPRGSGPADRFAGTSFGQIRTKDAFLGQIMGVQKLAGGVTTVHPFTEAEPYWVIEVFQQGTSYFAPAQSAAEALAGLAVALAGGGPATEPTAER